MNKYIWILIALFVLVFIGQQSHMVVTSKVYIPELGTYKEDYHIKIENLTKYLRHLPQEIAGVPSKVRALFPRPKPKDE